MDFHAIFGLEIKQDVVGKAVLYAHIHRCLAHENVLSAREIIHSRIAQDIVPEMHALRLIVLHRDDGVGNEIHFLVAAVEEPGNVLERLGPERVVGIEEEEVLAPRGLYPGIASRRDTTILLSDDLRPRMFRNEAFQNV